MDYVSIFFQQNRNLKNIYKAVEWRWHFAWMLKKLLCLTTQSQKMQIKLQNLKKRCFVFLSSFLWQTSTYLHSVTTQMIIYELHISPSHELERYLLHIFVYCFSEFTYHLLYLLVSSWAIKYFWHSATNIQCTVILCEYWNLHCMSITCKYIYNWKTYPHIATVGYKRISRSGL